MLTELACRTAVVTGAASGIGAAGVASRPASREAFPTGSRLETVKLWPVLPKNGGAYATLTVRLRRSSQVFRAAHRPNKAMVSTFAATLLAALGLAGPLATPAAKPVGGSFFASGHGWGHGVGMAQYGAYGYALHGWTYDQIVAHYYPGTELGDAPVKRVRVLLSPAAKNVVISSKSSLPRMRSGPASWLAGMPPAPVRVTPGSLSRFVTSTSSGSRPL